MAWKYQRTVLPNGRTCYKSINFCEKCGIEFIAENPSSTKYCPDCGKEIRAQQNRDRVRRYREKLKKQAET